MKSLIQHFCAGLLAALIIAAPAHAAGVEFGDDSSEWANDGECDDRRFIGTGMATSLDKDDNFHDATDCRKLYEAGQIKLVSEEAGKLATQCDQIDFGDNSSEWANDQECDDPRFDGPGTAGVIAPDDLQTDANDCMMQCERGRIWLRTAAD